MLRVLSVVQMVVKIISSNLVAHVDALLVGYCAVPFLRGSGRPVCLVLQFASLSPFWWNLVSKRRAQTQTMVTRSRRTHLLVALVRAASGSADPS
jgi:hypothetical protein